ncbi:hypothetical protein G6L78_01390 [Agrobacterium rhizogenes]|nr:hypothetical protein [Rhizobium rhizogenes]
MLTNFERLAKSSRSVVEHVHGTDVTIYPVVRQGSNGPLRLSPTIAPYDTSALFFENTLIESEQKAQPFTGTGRMLHRSLIRTASIRLIDGAPLKTDFILKRKADGALFSITQFDPDGVGNVMATLGSAASLPEA